MFSHTSVHCSEKMHGKVNYLIKHVCFSLVGNYLRPPDNYIQLNFNTKIVSEYDQEIPQSQTADNPMAPRGRAAQPSRDTRKTN